MTVKKLERRNHTWNTFLERHLHPLDCFTDFECNGCFPDRRLSPQANTRLSNVLCPHYHASEKLPRRSPIFKLPGSSTLNFGVLMRWAPEKKMHLVDIDSNIISFKHLLNRTFPYQHGLGTFTLDHHLTQAVWDCIAYLVLSSFWLKGFWLSHMIRMNDTFFPCLPRNV